MDREEVEACVIEAVQEVQRLSGCPDIKITRKTRPMEDLPDFDSLRGVETVVVLCAKLGREIACGKDDVNLFGCGGKVFSIADVTDRVLGLLVEEAE